MDVFVTVVVVVAEQARGSGEAVQKTWLSETDWAGPSSTPVKEDATSAPS